MIITSCAICAPGFIRTENQDNLYINGIYRNDIADNSVFFHADKVKSNGLYAVADGMGGEKHGEIAALIAVQDMSLIIHSDDGQSIIQYLIERNDIICDLIIKNNVRIGSTFAGLYINNKTAYIVNIGDSRVYLLRSGVLWQMSRDHTSIQQMIDMNVMTKEKARLHPDRHKLTQHLGILPSEMIIEPFSTKVELQDTDTFLLCSDGLTDMLENFEIENELNSTNTIKQKTENLYNAAFNNGGKDNITILTVQVKKGLLG